MFPTILQIGPITVSSLGIMIALGFFFGSFLIWKNGKEENFDDDKIMDAILIISLVSLLTSRLDYIFWHWQELGENLAVYFNFVSKPGFSWLGAFLGGGLVLKFICYRNKWDFFKVADFSVFGLCLAIFFIDFGLFLDGNSLSFYESIFMLLVLKLLYYFDKNYRTYKWYQNKRGEAAPGFLALTFLLLFILKKIIVDFFKLHNLYWRWGLLIEITIILISLIGFYFRSGKKFELKYPKIPKIKTKNKRRKPLLTNHLKTGMEAK